MVYRENFCGCLLFIPHFPIIDIFTDCQNKFDNDKYHFLSLLEETIDFDEIVPTSFVSHFHALTERPRIHCLYPMFKSLFLQRIFSIPTDSLLIILYSEVTIKSPFSSSINSVPNFSIKGLLETLIPSHYLHATIFYYSLVLFDTFR